MKTFKLLIFLLLPYYVYAHTINKECPLYDKKWECKDGLYRVLKWCEYNDHIMPLYGFVDEKDNVVIPIKYDYAEDMCNGYALVATRTEPLTELFPLPPIPKMPNYRYGYISKNNIIVGPFFDYATSISPIDSSIVIGFNEVKHHIVEASQYVIKKHKVNWTEFYHKYEASNGWYQGRDLPEYTGEVVFPNPFDNMYCDEVMSGEAKNMSFEGFTIKQNGIIVDNKIGSEIFIRHLREDYDEDNIWFSGKTIGDYLIGTAHGYIGIFEHLSPRFDAISFCGNNTFAASYNGKWGVINLQGDIIQPFIYSYIVRSQYNDKLCTLFKFTGKTTYDFKRFAILPEFVYGCMDLTGKILVPVKYNKLSTAQTNLIFAKDSLWSVYDMSGNLLHDNKFSDIENINGEFTIFDLNQKKGCIDKSGNIILDPIYSSIDLWHSGTNYFIVKKEEKFGVVDEHNNIVLDFIYDNFSNSNADSFLKPFRMNGKEGYINIYSFKVEIPAQYDSAHSFENGLAVVTMDNKCGVINEKGETVLPINFLSASILNNKISVRDSNGNRILYDIYGNQIEDNNNLDIDIKW